VAIASEVATAAASDFEDLGDEGLGNIQAVVDDAPIVRYVNLLVLQALNERASDIHVEPTGENLRIRYRIDGVLHDISTAPRAIASAVTTRLKVMADLNIAEHRLPQDGRLSLTVGKRPIDLRMATLPTIYGEKVVMRVLDKTNVVLGFEDLGFDPDLMPIYEDLFNRPYGTILVTGPTGSGKTTTLYATLAALNNPEKNIITVEDPSSCASRESRRCSSTSRRASPSRPRCGRSCDPTPTSCSSVRSATGRRPSSRSRPPSPATWCSPRCTPTTPPAHRCGSSRWGSSPTL